MCDVLRRVIGKQPIPIIQRSLWSSGNSRFALQLGQVLDAIEEHAQAYFTTGNISASPNVHHLLSEKEDDSG
ncbi:hypothetical protein AKJ16_DCAP00437 [Drosera capensis]